MYRMVTPEVLNEAGRDRLLEETNQMREMVMSFAHSAVKLYLGVDLARNSGENSGQATEYFVLAELLERPDEEARMSLTVRLESSIQDPEQNSTPRDSLTISYPIPDEMDISTAGSNPQDLPPADVIYFIYDKDGVKIHVSVKAGATNFYIPPDLTGPQVDEYDASNEILEGMEGKTVQSGLPLLAGLYEDLINMKGVVQRSVEPGQFLAEA